MKESRLQSLGWEDPLEEGIATHPSILAWKIPWTEEPGGLQYMGHTPEPPDEALVKSTNTASKISSTVSGTLQEHSKWQLSLSLPPSNPG